MNPFKSQTPKELQRAQQKKFKQIERGLTRDQQALERQEKQLIADIQKASRRGDQLTAKTLAKQLVRLRSQMSKNVGVKAQIGGISAQSRMAASNIGMATAMAKTTKIMATSNKQMSLEKMQATMQEFERQNSEMDMKGELMNDSIDNVLEESGDEEESQAIMDQILDEIGIDQIASMPSAASSRIGGSISQANKSASTSKSSLDDRLNQLKN
ncbi:hypothetical protein MP228_004956 [Amoeboaphelidium protococcarum]|nr:hypothetical protein MP228_004956 [Amoeboaphelidium protococcarum]